MKILFNQLKAIKEQNLPEILQSYGIKLKHISNSTYQGLCPFHDDRHPSLSVSKKNNKWLWHCFGCGAKGTVIDFVIKKEGLSFINAYKKLAGVVKGRGDGNVKDHGRLEATSRLEEKGAGVTQEKSIQAHEFNPYEILGNVTNFYRATFKEDRRGIEYLTKRGIRRPEIFTDYKIGFVNGTMKNTLPKDGELIDELKRIGILNGQGNEFFYNCIVIPVMDDEGNVEGVYGRNIDPFDKLRTRRAQHLYLPGPHRGVFNSKVLRTTKKVYIAESIIDSLSLIQMGINATVPLYGTNGLTDDHMKLLRKYMTKEVYLCLDNDEAGRNASARIGKQLSEFGIKVDEIILPEGIKDINDYLIAGNTKEDFMALVGAARRTETAPEQTDNGEKTGAKITEDESQITVEYPDRRYRIRGLSCARLDQLKVNIKIAAGDGSTGSPQDAYHLDTLDLYSARAREQFINQCRKVTGIDSAKVSRDVTFIVEHLEKVQEKLLNAGEKNQIDKIEMTDSEKEEALRFLRNENLMTTILQDFKAIGHVGEENNLLMGYLASVSRKLSTPLALLVVSRSASGKTTLQDAVLSFSPPEDYEKYTRMTDQSLFYKGTDSLKHRLLAIEEEKGASGCAYSLRNLQSAHGLSIATTMKDSATGKLKTEVYKVEGPTAIMITTTYSEEIDFETYNRFVVLTVDETINQTRKILERQRMNETIEGIMAKKRREKIERKHHNAQRLLRRLEVANPYSRQLTFIDTVLRARREQPKYLTMIKAVALLRQYQKEIKKAGVADKQIEYIEVDLKDIAIANRIANEVLGRALDELCPPARGLLIEIHRMVSAMAQDNTAKMENIIFTRRDVREFSRWSEYQVRMHMRQLEELEYLYPVSGKQGQRYAYQLLWDGSGVEGERFMMGLIDVERLVGTTRELSLRKVCA